MENRWLLRRELLKIADQQLPGIEHQEPEYDAKERRLRVSLAEAAQKLYDHLKVFPSLSIEPLGAYLGKEKLLPIIRKEAGKVLTFLKLSRKVRTAGWQHKGCSSCRCLKLPLGPLAQSLRHRPAEPEIPGSSPTRAMDPHGSRKTLILVDPNGLRWVLDGLIDQAFHAEVEHFVALPAS